MSKWQLDNFFSANFNVLTDKLGLQSHLVSTFSYLLLISAITKEAASCSVKKVFLKISQNSQENTCVCQSFFFNKVVGLRPSVAVSAVTNFERYKSS